VQKLRCDEVELFDREVWEAAQLVTRSRRAEEIPEPLRALCPQGIKARIEALSTMHEPYGLMQEIVNTAVQRRGKVIHWCLLDVLERCPPQRPCEGCVLQEDCQGAGRGAEGFFGIDDAIAMKHRVCKETWEAEMLCRRASRKSAVFTAFSLPRHVMERPWWDGELGLSRTLAIDFGYRNPFICLWILHDRAGRVFVLDELAICGTSLEQVIGKIRAKPYAGFNKVVCDPAGDQVNRQTSHTDIAVLRNAGFEVRRKSTRITDGLDLIKTALDPAAGEATLRIHPRCRELIRSMECYHYGKEVGSERPMKDNTNDHCVDALRYFYVNRPTFEEGARSY
jgi:hypothetical protein